MLAIRRPAFFYRLYSALAECMEKEGIVPDVIDCAPKEAACVSYPGGCKVSMGNELTPTQVRDQPYVQWEACQSMFYTLMMVDPDAPSRKEPKEREWHHWLVVNIPGVDICNGEVLSEYIGAGPPQGTCLHRYIFLIYRQQTRICFSDEPRLTNCSSEKRGYFSVKNFTCRYKLGKPVAGNFFVAQWDCYVPTLYKQLGMS